MELRGIGELWGLKGIKMKNKTIERFIEGLRGK